jgi:hypothetical protein
MADDTFVTMAHNRIFVTTVASNPLVNNLIIGLPRLLWRSVRLDFWLPNGIGNLFDQLLRQLRDNLIYFALNEKSDVYRFWYLLLGLFLDLNGLLFIQIVEFSGGTIDSRQLLFSLDNCEFDASSLWVVEIEDIYIALAGNSNAISLCVDIGQSIAFRQFLEGISYEWLQIIVADLPIQHMNLPSVHNFENHLRTCKLIYYTLSFILIYNEGCLQILTNVILALIKKYQWLQITIK